MDLFLRSVARLLLAFAFILHFGCANLPPADQPATLRILSYNIHHGEGLDGRLDLERIASLITATKADLVALQEVDRGVERTQKRDLPAELAALTGLQAVFHNNHHHQGGEYGNAILSRFPVVAVTNHWLPKLTADEQRGFLMATIRSPQGAILFCSTHLDHRREEGDRLAGVERILEVTRTATVPVIIAGDFNAVPTSETYRRMAAHFVDSFPVAGAGAGFTIPVREPRSRIDYVWYSKEKGLGAIKAEVWRSEASDHLPLLVELDLRPGRWNQGK